MDRETIPVVVIMLIAVMTLIVTPVAYYMHKNEKIAELVKSGVPPLDAACAFEGDRTSVTACTVRLQRP